MASGDTLVIFEPKANDPPAASNATVDTRNGHFVLDFDAAADESAVFPGVLPRHYDAGGVTVSLYWLATSAVTGDVVWNVAWERHQADTTDLDADDFAAVNAVTVTTNATSGAVNVDTITFTDGADMDSVAVGEAFRLKVTRDADNVSDTMAGDAELLRVEIRET